SLERGQQRLQAAQLREQRGALLRRQLLTGAGSGRSVTGGRLRCPVVGGGGLVDVMAEGGADFEQAIRQLVFRFPSLLELDALGLGGGQLFVAGAAPPRSLARAR